MKRGLTVFLCLAFCAFPASAQEEALPVPESIPAPEPEPEPVMADRQAAVLRAIDKVSARRHTFEIPVGKTVKFGSGLFIRAQACRSAPPLAQPESAAFLQIWERRPHEEASRWVFSGWMFASRPAVSAMEHPVYDVWVIDCKDAAPAPESAFTAEEAPEAETAEEEAAEPAE